MDISANYPKYAQTHREIDAIEADFGYGLGQRFALEELQVLGKIDTFSFP